MLDNAVEGAPASVETLSAAAAAYSRDGKMLPARLRYELASALMYAGRLGEALEVLDEVHSELTKSFNLTILRGVVLRRLGRLDEALASYRDAAKLDRKSLAPLSNMGNIYLDRGETKKAIETFSKLAAMSPRSAEYQCSLGIAYRREGDPVRAKQKLEMARRLAPNLKRAWINLAATTEEGGDLEAALEMLQTAAERFPGDQEVAAARLTILRRNGRRDEVIEWLRGLIFGRPNEAWLHFELGKTLAQFDRPAAIVSFRKAVALDQNSTKYLVELAENLNRSRDNEAANIAESYQLALRRLTMGGNLLEDARTVRQILLRAANYDDAERFGDFATLGSYWARSENYSSLHIQIAQVKTAEDRLRLVDYHRMWGRHAELLAGQRPIVHSPAITGRAKIRIGLMSSDLRYHPVAYFAAPLILGIDRSRFEVFCYSWNTKAPDRVQAMLADKVDVFRLEPTATDRQGAQLIANDQLDVLFDLGGGTDMNKIRSLAWRPTRRQASWLGYPHSAGLETIDRIITDPFITPTDPALLIEKPLELAHSWVAFEKMGFNQPAAIEPQTPEERTGSITFGTMNNPFKYNRELIAAWASVLKAVPGSRFLFVRPEGAIEAFRDNIARMFEGGGVARDRIDYVAVRGDHMRHYNAIDVALDTFPQTGGTTTCETLSMGVPVISLKGEAFYERLSHSNLNNAGLGDLSVDTVEAYVAKAASVARDTAWRTEFRRTILERLASHPLGRPADFVTDFQNAVVNWMDETA